MVDIIALGLVIGFFVFLAKLAFKTCPHCNSTIGRSLKICDKCLRKLE
jgi:hypothetical protein